MDDADVRTARAIGILLVLGTLLALAIIEVVL